MFSLIVEDAGYLIEGDVWIVSIKSELSEDPSMHNPVDSEECEAWPPCAYFCLNGLAYGPPEVGDLFSASVDLDYSRPYAAAYFSYHAARADCVLVISDVQDSNIVVDFSAVTEDTNSYFGDMKDARFEGRLKLRKVESTEGLWWQ